MSLLEFAGTQATIIRSYSALVSRDDRERYSAMTALRDCGGAARWCLQLAVRQTGQPRVQFGAAVVLHWLGDRQGLSTLTEALKWRLPAEAQIAAELESAFILIGSPDAVEALMTVWKMLPDWGDHEAVRASICRVWANLKNPVVLPVLAAGAMVNPARFEQTLPAFGEMAIPVLRELARAPDAPRRALAVQTLRHIPSASAFASLVPMLQDCERSLRALVPAALERTGSRVATVIEITAAVRNGYPSIDAIGVLLRSRPDDLGDTLTSMYETWSPKCDDRIDTEIVLMTLPPLLANAVDVTRTLSALCGVLARPLESRVAIAMIEGVELLARKLRQTDESVMLCLEEQLNAPSPAVRSHAAAALARLGDVFPGRVIAYLDQCKPHDTLVNQLQVILRGGRDAGEAANQAVQHVSKWWARLTAEAPDQKGTVPGSSASGADLAKSDPRLPPMLGRMLYSALRSTQAPRTAQEAEEKSAYIVLLLRALSQLGMPAVQCAWHDIVATLHLPGDAFAPAHRSPEGSKTYEATTLAAAEALMALYGPDSFALFLETLYSPRTEVVRTGVSALEIMGDSRGLQPLRAIAADAGHPCASIAARAVAQIRRTNPEMMTLLRGSSPAAADPETLLRAAHGGGNVNAADLLLRAAPERQQSG